MFTKIRALSYHLLFKLATAMVVVSFIAWGIADILKQKSEKTLVKFKHESSILENEFLAARTNKIKYIQNVTKTNVTDEQLQKIDYLVLEDLINSRVFNHVIKYYNLCFSDENVIGEIKKSEHFLDKEKKFSYDIFHNILTQNSISKKQYLESVKKDLEIKMIFDIFDNSLLEPNMLSNEIMKYLNTEITFDLVSILPIKATGHISDLEIKKIFDKEEFATEEYRDIEYVEISQDIINVTVLEEEIQSYYQENIQDYQSPPLISFQEIIVDSKKESEDIILDLKNGKSAESLNLKNIRTKNYQQLEGKVFEILNQSEIGSFEQDGKYHILKKLLCIPAKSTPVEKARGEIISIVKQRKFDQQFNVFIRTIDDFVATAENLAQVAQKFNLTLHTKKKLPKTPENIFSQKTYDLQENDFSEIFELESGKRAIIFLKHIEPSRKLSFEEAKTIIKSRLFAAMARQEAISTLNKIASEGAQEFEHNCKKAGLEISRSKKMIMAQFNAGLLGDIPRNILAQLFSMNAGSITTSIEFDNKIYMAILRNRSHSRNLQQDKLDLARNFHTSVMDEMLEFFKKDTGVTILK